MTPSITIDNVIAALADFLDPLMPAGTQIVRAQVNRVAMPEPPCIVLTEMGQYDLATTRNTYDMVTGADFQRSTRIDVQIDFYDGQAGEMCIITRSFLSRISIMYSLRRMIDGAFFIIRIDPGFIIRARFF